MGKPRLIVTSNITGTCIHPVPGGTYPISGIVSKGSKDVLINNKPAATITSNITTTCPMCGNGIIVAGDNTVLINGLPSAVVTSNIILGSGMAATAIKGSDNVL